MSSPGTGCSSRASLLQFSCIALLMATACAGPDTAASDGTIEGDHFLPSRPETVSWGWYPIDKEPVLTIRSGETVRINTLTHVGATQGAEPVEYLTGLGIPREEIHQDVLDFWASKEGRPREGRSGHVITGPIYVEGAQPGDMLEVQILALETRVPWGINNTSSRGGVFSSAYPGVEADDPPLDIPPGTRHVIRTAMVDGREVALFSPDIQVPLAPFMGIMAVAPDPCGGRAGRDGTGCPELEAAGRLRGQHGCEGSQGRHDPLPSSLSPRGAFLYGGPAQRPGRR